MKNMRPFQIVILAIFGFLAIVALIFLTAFQAEKRTKELVYGEKVVVWGTLPQSEIKDVFQEITNKDKAFNAVEYYQVAEETFDDELVNAIAEGRSPDLVVLRSDAIVTHQAKLYPIPYDIISERDFKDSYIDGAEIFAFPEGIYGVPFAVDPMVLFWNRDLFASNGLAEAPTTWEEIVNEVVPKLTQHDTNRNIIKSGIAFGEFRNVAHAKEMLLLLALQSGSKMVTQEEKKYEVSLNTPIVEGARAPLEAAVQFYTDFSNVNSPLYSWNRSLNTDKNEFIGGDLGLYFGLGSEVQEIGNKNPNLNFDITMMPQGAGATARRTYGDFYAFAIPRASQNERGAFAAARVLTGAENGNLLASAVGMVSPRRDVLGAKEGDLYKQIIMESAIIARGWFDPSPAESGKVFMQMVEDITSNRARIGEAVNDAIDRLTLIY
jgi:ABC-type glycerol-3-phosphate transport system substrate-binding protein